VELIAQKHCSLDIQPEQYPIVGKHLLIAIKDVLGDAATDEIIGAWGNAYGFLAEVLIGREKEIYAQQAANVGGWNGYRPFIVEKKVPENNIVTSFYLRPADGGELPAYQPGQYLTVKIDHPETPTSPRNYSLSDRSGTGYYRISVKREPAPKPDAPGGLISNHLHDRVNAGDQIHVGPPCGEFILDHAQAGEKPIVLLSGGIGVTPILSMLKTLAHHKTTGPVHFIHAALNSQSHALANEVKDIVKDAPHIKTHVRYSDPLPDDMSQKHCDSVGYVDKPLLDELISEEHAAQAAYYFCGPKPFMTNVYRELKNRGVNEENIHFEFFGPRQDITQG